MTSNQRNMFVWATVIAYTLCHFFLFTTKAQNYGGLIVVGICSLVISYIYLKTCKTLSKIEKRIEIISAGMVFVITIYMITKVLKISGLI